MNTDLIQNLLVPALIIFREGLEAFLLTTLLLKITEKDQLQHRYIAGGVFLGIFASILFALMLWNFSLNYESIVSWSGVVTALIMFYVAFYNRKVSQHIKEHLSTIKNLTPFALMIAVATVFLREGAEVVLMLWGLFNNDPQITIFGSILGVVLLFTSYKIIKFGLDKIGTAMLFKYSSWLFIALGCFYLFESAESLLFSLK